MEDKLWVFLVSQAFTGYPLGTGTRDVDMEKTELWRVAEAAGGHTNSNVVRYKGYMQSRKCVQSVRGA